jgi:hypothetical protein
MIKKNVNLQPLSSGCPAMKENNLFIITQDDFFKE